MITHRERVQACLRGELPDRPPVALWRHFPVDDQTPDALAAAHVAFQKNYDWDIVKVTPASSYSVKDWGVEDIWEGSAEGTRSYSKYVVHGPEDWQRLPVLEPDALHLAAHIACLRQIRRLLGPDTPILLTVFSPLSQAKHLAGEETLLTHLRQFPDAVHQGLQTITESTQRFIRAAVETGIDGIFYAIQHAQAHLLEHEAFVHWSRVSDLTLLHSADDLWCNMLHLHGKEVYFDAVADYPAHIINWHDRETRPSLAEARAKWSGILCGGLALDTLVYKTPAEIRRESQEAFAGTQSRNLILSTGCVIPIITPHGNIVAARESIHRSPASREPAAG